MERTLRGLEEPEVGGIWEARAEDAVIDHGEVERQHDHCLVARRWLWGQGEDPWGLLVLPQVQAAHLHGRTSSSATMGID